MATPDRKFDLKRSWNISILSSSSSNLNPVVTKNSPFSSRLISSSTSTIVTHFILFSIPPCPAANLVFFIIGSCSAFFTLIAMMITPAKLYGLYKKTDSFLKFSRIDHSNKLHYNFIIQKFLIIVYIVDHIILFLFPYGGGGSKWQKLI